MGNILFFSLCFSDVSQSLYTKAYLCMTTMYLILAVKELTLIQKIAVKLLEYQTECSSPLWELNYYYSPAKELVLPSLGSSSSTTGLLKQEQNKEETSVKVQLHSLTSTLQTGVSESKQDLD